MEFDAEKQTFAVIVGTTVATIFGPVPPQETALIWRVKYLNPTAGTNVAFLLSAPSLTGYSTMGTVSPNGSIVDSTCLAGGSESGGSQDGDSVVAVVPPGSYLTAVAQAGSVIINGLYSYKLGRST